MNLELSDLAPAQKQVLQSVNGPSRYLGIETDEPTGEVRNSVLLASPSLYHSSMNSTGFQKLYQKLRSADVFCTERFVRPDEDFFEEVESQGILPWSSGSHRSVDEFPVWLLYLNHPGELFLAEDLVTRIMERSEMETRPFLVALSVFPFDRYEIPSDWFDCVLDPRGRNGEGQDLISFLESILREPESSFDSPVHSIGNGSVISRDELFPIPPVRSQEPDSFVLGYPISWEENYLLEAWHWPTVPELTGKEWIELTEDIVNRTGQSNARLGLLHTDPGQNRELLLEYAQRFASKFKNQAVSYSLMNPRPGLALWEYPEITRPLRNSDLSFCIGSISRRNLTVNNTLASGMIDAVLGNYYESMEVVAGIEADRDVDMEPLLNLVDVLKQELNRQNRSGVELKIQLQPDLNLEVPEWYPLASLSNRQDKNEEWPTESSWATQLQRIREGLEEEGVQVTLHLPDAYGRLRECFSG